MKKLLKGAVWTLSPAEQILAGETAILRQKANECVQADTHFWGKGSPFEQGRDAVGGEIAFARLAEVEPNLYSSQKWVGLPDCTLPDGRTVDTKYNWRPDGDLLVYAGTDHPFDVFTLMRGTFPTYSYSGWIERSTILRPDRLTYRFRKGPCYFMLAGQLHEDLFIFDSPEALHS